MLLYVWWNVFSFSLSEDYLSLLMFSCVAMHILLWISFSRSLTFFSLTFTS